jgi:outer membrane lipoprotein-sorting protein
VLPGAAPAVAQSAAQDPNAQALYPDAEPLEEQEQARIFTEIEAYFDSVNTLQARFLQYNMDGSVYPGAVMIDRPGHMRIEYDEPVPYKIIANGEFYIFVDEQMEEASYIPLGLTPANILLRQPLELEEALIVDQAVRTDDMLFVTVREKESPDAGSLTLGFREAPLSLLQWTVIDPQGAVTRVALREVRTGMELADDLFVFNNPWITRDAGN